jgi:hypothetical protein
LRLAYVALGGLSSLIVFPITALMVLRAAVERTRSEIIVAAFAVAIALIHATGLPYAPQRHFGGLDSISAIGILNNYLGAATFGGRYANYFPSGLLVLAVLALCVWLARRKLSPFFWLLVLAYLAVTAGSVMRADLAHHNAIGYGPRYFVYPFATLAWATFWLAAVSPAAIRTVLIAGWLAGPAITMRSLTSTHPPADWRGNLALCARADAHVFPSYFHALEPWRITLTGAQCRALIERSLIRPAGV